jgi:hypothetical protein
MIINTSKSRLLIMCISFYTVISVFFVYCDDNMDPSERKYFDKVSNLLKYDIKETDKTEMFFEAIAKGYMYVVELLIENGVDVNDKHSFGNSPLCYAVQYNYKDIVELLIENGADVNATCYDGASYKIDTLLHIAAALGNIEIMEILIEKGVDVNKKTLMIQRKNWIKHLCILRFISIKWQRSSFLLKTKLISIPKTEQVIQHCMWRYVKTM